MSTCHLCLSTKYCQSIHSYCDCPPAHRSCVNYARSDEDRPMVPNGPLWVCPTCHQRYSVAQANRRSYQWIKFWVYGRILTHITYMYLILYLIIAAGIQTYYHYDDIWTNRLLLVYVFYPMIGFIFITLGVHLRWGTTSKLVRRTYREVLVRAYPPMAVE